MTLCQFGQRYVIHRARTTLLIVIVDYLIYPMCRHPVCTDVCDHPRGMFRKFVVFRARVNYGADVPTTAMLHMIPCHTEDMAVPARSRIHVRLIHVSNTEPPLKHAHHTVIKRSYLATMCTHIRVYIDQVPICGCQKIYGAYTRDGTRTRNLLLRREAPYPLGHTSRCED